MGAGAGDLGTRVTALLQAATGGDDPARDQLFHVLYGELRRAARSEIAKGPRATIEPTALVNEAYVRLLGGSIPRWENRRHFFFTIGRAMRDVLIDQARRRAALRRGGDWGRTELASLQPTLETPADELVALDGALEKLRGEDERKADIVHLRFYAGLGEEEVAEVLGISRSTVSREWRQARARLALLVRPDDGG